MTTLAFNIRESKYPTCTLEISSLGKSESHTLSQMDVKQIEPKIQIGTYMVLQLTCNEQQVYTAPMYTGDKRHSEYVFALKDSDEVIRIPTETSWNAAITFVFGAAVFFTLRSVFKSAQ